MKHVEKTTGINYNAIDERRNSKELKTQCSGIIKARNAIVKIKLKDITFIIFLEDELERISTTRG